MAEGGRQEETWQSEGGSRERGSGIWMEDEKMYGAKEREM